MPYPEGYRKAMRVMELADRLGFPLITLVDTPGAYPGLAAEQHGQGGAIARSQAVMSRLKVPTVACVIGEGGSGGAIAIALADRVLMQQNAIYSVISPEGCAAILWRDAAQAKKAAAAFKPDAVHCLELGVIDSIVPEPEGGAHADHDGAAQLLRESLRGGARRARRRAGRRAQAAGAERSSAPSASSPERPFLWRAVHTIHSVVHRSPVRTQAGPKPASTQPPSGGEAVQGEGLPAPDSCRMLAIKHRRSAGRDRAS